MILSYGCLALPKYSWRSDRYSSLESVRDQQRDSYSLTKSRTKVSSQFCLLYIDWRHFTSLLHEKRRGVRAGRKETERCTLRLAAFTSNRVLHGNGRKEKIFGLLTKNLHWNKVSQEVFIIFLPFFFLFSLTISSLYSEEFVSLLPSCFAIFQFKKCKK